MTYAEHLARQGHAVHLVARAGTLLSEAFATLEDDVVTAFPNLVIIHYGIVEVCYRQTIRCINNVTIRNYYLNRRFEKPYVFASLRNHLCYSFWRALNGLIRRSAALSGLRWQWLPPSRFLEVMDAITKVLLKETAAHVLIMGLNIPSSRIDRILSGSAEAVTFTNAHLAKWSARHGSRVSFLDPNKFDLSDRIPDGIHFSAEGHRLLAEAIVAHLHTQNINQL